LAIERRSVSLRSGGSKECLLHGFECGERTAGCICPVSPED
jgi:hypothetical protein